MDKRHNLISELLHACLFHEDQFVNAILQANSETLYLDTENLTYTVHV